LTAAGCGALQGYAFGRPMPPREVRILLDAGGHAHGDDEPAQPAAVPYQRGALRLSRG
jgi:hypothetical protein